MEACKIIFASSAKNGHRKSSGREIAFFYAHFHLYGRSLCRLVHRDSVPTYHSVLDFVVQFLNVMRHGQKNDGDKGVFSAPAQEPAKPHVCFDVRKRAFCLDAPVDTQLDTFFRCDPREVFFPLAQELLRDDEALRPFFHRLLEMVPVDAVCFHRAVPAVLTGVAGFLAPVAGLRLRLVRSLNVQLASVRAEVGVFVGKVRHVLEATDVVLPFPRLALLVVDGLDEGLHAVIFEVRVVLFALVAGICNDVLAARPVRLLEFAQEGDKGVGVGRLWADARPEDELGVAAVLDVVGGLELAVLHGVFFHAHEGRVLVGLREAVATSHLVEFCDVMFQPYDIAVELFERALERCFPLAGTVDESDAVF